MWKKLVLFLAIFVLLGVSGQAGSVHGQGSAWTYLPVVMTTRPPQQPVLKWAYGGCFSSWCETAWYSSPAAADLDGDGINEVLASAYILWALDGLTGETVWSVNTDGGRTWPGVVVADIDREGHQEIVIAQSGSYVTAYRINGNGTVTQLWQRVIDGGNGEFRGLLAADLDGNGSNIDIVATQTGDEVNTWVFDAAGNTRSGWPQLAGEYGYAWGVYNANAAAANLRDDAALELVVPSDVHYINIYEPNGAPVLANPIYNDDGVTKYWGQVGVWESTIPEERGWGACDGDRVESYRTNFADGPAALADMNGDGQKEVIAVGNTYDCDAGYPPSRYMAVYIFNADRTRFQWGSYDWNTIPVDTGAPISEDYDVIESVMPNPVIADLDGDGLQEILYASYDGRLHAFWLDKTEHGSWPYSVYKPAEGFFRFASEPVVADLNNDGQAEVIFTSWTEKGSYAWGKLHMLDSNGVPLYEIDLPAPRSDQADWNGAMAAPTLADVDADNDLELIVNTAYSGVVVYDLPETEFARILWGTGRGNFQRTGSK